MSQSLRRLAWKTSWLVVLTLWGTTARADVRFAELSVDAGEVRTGRPLVHKFVFVNQGPESVEITVGHTSCGCLTPHLDKNTYQAGEEGCVLLEVNTLSQPAGLQNWHVDLNCQVGNTSQEIELHLTARMITEITVQPAAMVVYTDSAVGHEVILTDLREKPLTVTEVRTSSPWLRSRVEGESRDESGHRVCKMSMEVGADYPEGRHAEVLAICTDDPAYRELKIPVTIVKRPRQRLTAMPGEVSLAAPPGQPVPSRIVLVRDRDNEEVVVDRIEADDPAVVCKWAKGPGAMATVKLGVDRSRVQGGTLQTTVHVHVSKPVPQELAIPLVCTVR